MTQDDREKLLQYLELCRRIYERMEREGTWPWSADADSQDSDDVVESDDNQKGL